MEDGLNKPRAASKRTKVVLTQQLSQYPKNPFFLWTTIFVPNDSCVSLSRIHQWATTEPTPELKKGIWRLFSLFLVTDSHHLIIVIESLRASLQPMVIGTTGRSALRTEEDNGSSERTSIFIFILSVFCVYKRNNRFVVLVLFFLQIKIILTSLGQMQCYYFLLLIA